MIMSAPPASRGSSISQHLRAIKEILRDLISDAKYVQSHETHYIGGLRLGIAGLQQSKIRLRSNNRTKWTRGLRLTRTVS